MKYIALAVMACLFISVSRAQNPYYDALFLKRYGELKNGKASIDINGINGADTLQLNNISARYVEEGNNIEDMFNSTSDNPFISIVPGKKSQASSPSSFLSGALNAAGAVDVTTMVDGMAKFLVERTKQELSIAFFNDFKEKLEAEEQLRLLFPATYQNLKVIGDEIYMFSGYIEMLREGFKKDISGILINMRKLVNSDAMKAAFEAFPPLKTMLSGGLYLADQLGEGHHIGDAIHSYVINDEILADSLNLLEPDVFGTLVVFDFVSQSLRYANPETRYWISFDDMQAFKDELTFKIYLGLLFQQLHLYERQRGIKLTLVGKGVRDLLREGASSLVKLSKLRDKVIVPVLSKGARVDKSFIQIKELNNHPEKGAEYQNYHQLFSASLDFMETSQGVYQSLVDGHELQELSNYIMSFRYLSDMHMDISEKQYVSAISDLASWYRDFVIDRITEGPLKEEHEAFLKAFIKYGNFAAIVAKAETSDEVQQAIEAVALPVGSSRIKRYTSFNVALNAYVGLYGGYENIEINDEDNYQLAAGLSAPVGVAMSWGGKGSSFSVFLSLIDIGSVASFRFNDDATESVPQIQLKDIISPGVFGVYGFKDVPLSAGAGYQIGPRLHEVTVDNADMVSETYGRFSVFLAVDIHIINFHSKAKKD
ncbi:hypothetical protein [Fulvivirga sediminis]|uniref:Uncharacterized protein n=1 Tax=Fulvivirga sediminis TaxID=2803949 RepID=A0A937F984_9BACT|nr:hypothetical protein [Fulvivirga sediminis]MBL3656614.1 hypothetical protein [Fulvivirga sediminis]